MGEQFHNGKHEIVRGREDVGCRCLRSALSGSSTPGSLTEDNVTRIAGYPRCGLGQEIFQFLPTFLAKISNIDVDDVASF